MIEKTEAYGCKSHLSLGAILSGRVVYSYKPIYTLLHCAGAGMH